MQSSSSSSSSPSSSTHRHHHHYHHPFIFILNNDIYIHIYIQKIVIESNYQLYNCGLINSSPGCHYVLWIWVDYDWLQGDVHVNGGGGGMGGGGGGVLVGVGWWINLHLPWNLWFIIPPWIPVFPFSVTHIPNTISYHTHDVMITSLLRQSDVILT